MKRPNIVLIISHDQGRRLGCYGYGDKISPNIDALAAEGARMDRAFCTQALCSPSRASLFTGRYPHSNGVMGLIRGAFKWDLHKSERHMAGLLHDAGYGTALVGIQHETERPGEMGFETIADLSGSHEDPVADAAIKSIASLAASDRPFYLQIGFNEVHRRGACYDWGPVDPRDATTCQVPGYLVDSAEARDEFAQLHSCVRRMDAAIGRILAAIDNHHLAENTLVIFTTDHGIAFPRAKTSLFDPGMEVALAMRWPGVISGGRAYSELVSNVDILPTIMDLAGLSIPANIQGRSFAALLQGKAYDPRDAIFGEMNYHNYCDPMRCVRTADYKLILNFMPCAAIYNPTQQWRPKTMPTVPADPKNQHHVMLELYDLRADPLEHKNLADDEAHGDVRSRLLRRLNLHMKETDDPLLEGLPLPKRFYDAQKLLREAGGER